MKNTVATIAKVYAIINAIAGMILFTSVFEGAYAVIFVAAVIVASFFIYCIGEGLQLLQDIKNGTNGVTTQDNQDALPEI